MSCSTCPGGGGGGNRHAYSSSTSTYTMNPNYNNTNVPSNGFGFGSYPAHGYSNSSYGNTAKCGVVSSTSSCNKPSGPCINLPPVTTVCAYPPCEPFVNCIVEAAEGYDEDSEDDLCSDNDCCSSCPSDGSLCGSCGLSGSNIVSSVTISSGDGCCKKKKKGSNRCPPPSDLPRCFNKYLKVCNVPTYYSVSVQGNGMFTSIRAAVAQALRDPTTGPVVVNIDVGLYSLDESLNNSRQITFLGSSVDGVPATHIVGTATSGGNKSWIGVHFTGRRTVYSVGGPESSGCSVGDTLHTSHIGENAQFRNSCNNLGFYNCTFNYNNLKKGARILQKGGDGNIVVRDGTINIKRCGSTCGASSFHCHAGSSGDSLIHSLWQDNVWNVSIDGSTNFNLHQIVGDSHVHLQSDTVNILKSSAIVAVAGNDTPVNNVQLSIHSIHVQGPDLSNQQNAVMLRNLFSANTIQNHIAVQAATVENGRAALYDVPITDGTLVNSYLTFTSTRVSAPTGVSAWQFLLGGTTTMNLALRGVNHNTFNSNVSPVVFTQQAPGASAQIWLASHTMFNYGFTGLPAAAPPWITTTVTTTNAGVDNVTGYFVQSAGIPPLPAGFGAIIN